MNESTSGFIGWSAPQARRHPLFKAWAFALATAPLSRNEQFALYVTTHQRQPAQPVHRIQSHHLEGLLFGTVYSAPDIPAEPVVDGTLSANRVLGDRLDAAYVRAKESGFVQVDGIYCLVLRVRATGEILLYQDGSSARPIYYANPHRGVLVFASRLSDLVVAPGIGKTLSSQGFHEYLRFFDISAPQTIYRAVRAVEPDTCVRFDGSHATICRLDTTATSISQSNEVGWHLGGFIARGDAVKCRPALHFDQATTELERHLVDSIRKRIARLDRIGIFLSGGVDSALVCALAQTLAPARCEAITVGFSDAPFDETPIATDLAKAMSIPHQALYFTHQEYRAAFDLMTARIELPFADPAMLPTWLAMHYCAKEGLFDMLDGTGADALVGVMPARHVRIASQYAVMLPRWLRSLMTDVLNRIPPLRRFTPIIDFADPETLFTRWHGFSQQEIAGLVGGPVDLTGSRFYRVRRRFPRNRHLERYSALLASLPDDRLHHSANYFGINVHFPYGDAEVQGFIRTLPTQYRYTPKEPKRILKALLAKHVDRGLWDRPKHGFDFPFVAFLRYNDCEVVRTYLQPADAFDAFPALRPAPVRHLIGRFLQGDQDKQSAFRVWALVVLAAWLRNHYMRISSQSHLSHSHHGNA